MWVCDCFWQKSVGGGAGDAGGDDAVADLVELFVGGFQQALGGRLAVDGVDHHLLGLDLLDGLQPGDDVFVAGIVDGIRWALSFER